MLVTFRGRAPTLIRPHAPLCARRPVLRLRCLHVVEQRRAATCHVPYRHQASKQPAARPRNQLAGQVGTVPQANTYDCAHTSNQIYQAGKDISMHSVRAVVMDGSWLGRAAAPEPAAQRVDSGGKRGRGGVRGQRRADGVAGSVCKVTRDAVRRTAGRNTCMAAMWEHHNAAHTAYAAVIARTHGVGAVLAADG